MMHMGMKYNKIRKLLTEGKSSVATRMWSSNPYFAEVLGSYKFDYMEFLAEYSPFGQYDLPNICRAAELNEMGTMIKVDFLNRGYIAQKAIGSGFQAILFADHRKPEDFEETINLMKAETPEWGGMFGFPNNRFIGGQSHLSQLDHAKRVNEVVLAFMIEKQSAIDSIEEICSIPGIDMVQFGPSDYSMSAGKNRAAYSDEAKDAERKMIKVALDHGIQPRCEISCAEEARYYLDLGVKHFCVGDQLKVLKSFWQSEGEKMAELCAKL